MQLGLENINTSQGYIIEGYPRNIEQVLLMEMNKVKYDLLIELFQPEEVILSKVAHRKVCKTCCISYNNHEFFIGEYKLLKISPKIEDICDKCGNPLKIRNDDNRMNVKRRYFDYQVNHEQMKKYFTSKEKYLFFNVINGIQDFSRLVGDIDHFLHITS